MIKRQFLIFITIIGLLIGGLVWFLQSPQFALVLKTVAFKYLPKDIGIQGDFSDLSIQLFPPGFSIQNPQLMLSERNILDLPAGSSVVAEKVEVNFRPLQILSGEIRANEVLIFKGSIRLVLESPTAKKAIAKKRDRFQFHWDELLQIRSDSIRLIGVDLSIRLQGTSLHFESTANELRLSQWQGHGGLGYHVSLDLENTQSTYFVSVGLPETLGRIQGEAFLNMLGLSLESLDISTDSKASQNVKALQNGLDPGLDPFELSVSGKVHGDLLESKKLMTELNVKARGQLSGLLRLLTKPHSQSQLPSGLITWTGALKGDLMKPMETLRVEGQLIAQDVSFKGWSVDSVEADGKWDASASGGEIFLNHVAFVSAERPRVGGFQSGSGGQVEIGPVRWSVGSKTPIQIPLRLNRAHIHWLAAGAIASVYPLDFRVSGALLATCAPLVQARDWQVNVQVGVALELFQLDNQRYKRTAPLSVLFKVPKIQLSGPVSINSSEVRVSHVVLGIGRTLLTANGKINFKTGYDLYGSGSVNLDDFKKIANNEVSGVGPVGIHVHGPTSGVLIDIDPDFNNVKCLKMEVGSLKGRITWDDRLKNLIFNQLSLNKNSMNYSVNGVIDMTTDNRMNLIANIYDGSVGDLIQVFSQIIRPLSWFPQSLEGPVRGAITITGGTQSDKMKVTGSLDGTHWEQWGETFKTVHLEGGYDCGKYFIQQARIVKKFGHIEGRISYDQNHRLDWSLIAENMPLNDMNHIARLDIPTRGKLTVVSNGNGVEGLIHSNTQVTLSDFAIRGSLLPPSSLSWQTHQGQSLIHGVGMGGQGLLDVAYNIHSNETSSIRVEFRQLDFSPILLLLNPRSLKDTELLGLISAKLDLSFRAGSLEKADGAVKISEYLLSKSGAQFTLSNPVAFLINSGEFEIKGLSLRGKTGEVTLNLKSKGTKLDGNIQGDIDSTVLEFLGPFITEANGLLQIDLRLWGPFDQLKLVGDVQTDHATMRVAALDSRFDNISGKFVLNQNIFSVERLRGDLGGGFVTMAGRVVLFPNRYPDISIDGRISGSKVKIFPFQYLLVSGPFGVHGDTTPYTIDGSIQIVSALCKEKMLNSKHRSRGLKNLPFAPPSSQLQEAGSTQFKLNLGIDASNNIFIQNDLFRDVEVKGSLKLVNTIDAPRFTGRADIMRGNLLFKDHIFQIQSASAKYNNGSASNPSVDLNANTEVNGVKIQMFAAGKIDGKMGIEFTSNPAMPESDILSLLALGLTSNDAKKLSSSDQNIVQQGEVTSLLLHSMDFNRDFEDKTGFQVQVDESMNPQQGVSAFRPQGQADTAAAPQITIRKKLGDRVSLSVGSTVGVGSNKQNQINLDYLLNKDLSVTGVFTNYGSNGTAETQQQEPSTGLDLKFQKRFK